MCKEMLRRLDKGLAEKKKVVPKELRSIARDAVAGVKGQLSTLVNNLVENPRHDLELNAKKRTVQKTIRELVTKWEKEWTEKRNLDSHILDEDLSIPDMIPELGFEGSDVEEDSEDDMNYDAMDVDEDEDDDESDNTSGEDDDPKDEDFNGR